MEIERLPTSISSVPSPSLPFSFPPVIFVCIMAAAHGSPRSSCCRSWRFAASLRSCPRLSAPLRAAPSPARLYDGKRRGEGRSRRKR
jgi:hypothetical protein